MSTKIPLITKKPLITTGNPKSHKIINRCSDNKSVTYEIVKVRYGASAVLNCSKMIKAMKLINKNGKLVWFKSRCYMMNSRVNVAPVKSDISGKYGEYLNLTFTQLVGDDYIFSCRFNPRIGNKTKKSGPIVNILKFNISVVLKADKIIPVIKIKDTKKSPSSIKMDKINLNTISSDMDIGKVTKQKGNTHVLYAEIGEQKSLNCSFWTKNDPKNDKPGKLDWNKLLPASPCIKQRLNKKAVVEGKTNKKFEILRIPNFEVSDYGIYQCEGRKNKAIKSKSKDIFVSTYFVILPKLKGSESNGYSYSMNSSQGFYDRKESMGLNLNSKVKLDCTVWLNALIGNKLNEKSGSKAGKNSPKSKYDLHWEKIADMKTGISPKKGIPKSYKVKKIKGPILNIARISKSDYGTYQCVSSPPISYNSLAVSKIIIVELNEFKSENLSDSMENDIDDDFKGFSFPSFRTPDIKFPNFKDFTLPPFPKFPTFPPHFFPNINVPDSPNAIVKAWSQFVKIGTKAILNCSTKFNNLNSNMKWAKMSRVANFDKAPSKSVLRVISKVRDKDLGIYKCFSAYRNLQFEGYILLHNNKLLKNGTPLDISPLLQNPLLFDKILIRVKPNSGISISLNCPLYGINFPNTPWKKLTSSEIKGVDTHSKLVKRPQKPIKKAKYLPNGSLFMSNITKEDLGLYACYSPYDDNQQAFVEVKAMSSNITWNFETFIKAIRLLKAELSMGENIMQINMLPSKYIFRRMTIVDC
ncbi:unnamed protein product [Gordionus sp. m RMFG-2023]